MNRERVELAKMLLKSLDTVRTKNEEDLERTEPSTEWDLPISAQWNISDAFPSNGETSYR